MVSKMFTALRNTYETSKTLNKANGRFVTMKPRTPTVAARFHDSLQQLLESMSKLVYSHSFYAWNLRHSLN